MKILGYFLLASYGKHRNVPQTIAGLLLRAPSSQQWLIYKTINMNEMKNNEKSK